MLFFRTLGIMTSFSSKTWLMKPVTERLAIERSCSVVNKRPEISYSTSGSTHVVLTSGTSVSSQMQSTPCFTGIEMQQNATCSCLMSQYLSANVGPKIDYRVFKCETGFASYCKYQNLH